MSHLSAPLADRRVAALGSLALFLTVASAAATRESRADPLLASPYLSFDSGSQPASVAIGDLAGIGAICLAVANYAADTVSVLLNVGVNATAVGPARPGTSGVLQLLDLRPNPTRGRSDVRFLVPLACKVDVAVFDLAGRKLRSVADGTPLSPGEHGVSWDGRDDSGAAVGNGVYLLKVRAGGDVAVRKLVVLR